MCADSAVKNNLALAMAVLIIGGGCLGWVGNKAVDYTFADVRKNTESRIEVNSEISHIKTDSKNEFKHLEDRLDRIEETMADFAMMKDMLIRVDERTSKWEPTNDQ